LGTLARSIERALCAGAAAPELRGTTPTYGRVEVNGNASIPTAAITGAPAAYVPTAGTFAVAKDNLGYAVGGGVEGRIFPWLPANWTSKAEYLYLDLGSLNSGASFSGAFVSGRGLSPTSPMTGRSPCTRISSITSCVSD
jgi:hypothetical protein